MRVVESKATTREEAIQSALEDLGVEMYEVDNIEILDEGSKGFLGFGARQVHVKLTVENLPDKPRHAQDRPKQERQKQDDRQRNERPRNNRQRNNASRNERPRNDRKQEARKQDDRPRNDRQRNDRKQEDRPRNDRQRTDRQRNNRPQEDRKQEDRPRNDRPRNDRNAPRRDTAAAKPNQQQERKPQVSNETPAPVPAPKEEQQQPKSSRGRGNRRRQSMKLREKVPTTAEAVTEAPVAAPAPRPKVKEEAPAPRKERVPEEVNFDPISDDQGNEAAALLQDIIAKMEIEATVEFVRAEDETARLNVTSEDNAILIGRKGRNLSAMQYLINRMIARGDVAENTERLVVDAEGYIDRRRESLEELALSMASRAKEGARNFRLKPMSPQERRIIHVALQDDPDVRTYSLGDTLYRCVVISPKNAKPERGGNRRGGRGRGGRDRNGGRDEAKERHNPHGHDGDVDAGTFGD